MAGNPAGIVQGKDSIRILYPIDQTTQLIWKISSSSDQMTWSTRTSVLNECREVPMTNPKRILSGILLTDPTNYSGNCHSPECWFFFKTNWPCSSEPTSTFLPLIMSGDQGSTWINASEAIHTDVELGRVKDPKIFYHKETQKWVMVATTDQRVHFFESTDLRSWKQTGMFGPAGNIDLQWENAELIKVMIEEEMDQYRWVLSVTAGHPAARGYAAVQYFIGQFDGKNFFSDYPTDKVNLLDHGRDFNAAIRVQPEKNISENDFPLITGKIGNNLYGDDLPDRRLHGMLSLARKLTLKRVDNKLVLYQEPAIKPKASEMKVVSKIEDLSGVIHAEINIHINITENEKTGIYLLKTAEQQLEIGFDPATRSVYVDRSACGFTGFYPDFGTIDRYNLQEDISELNLKIFLDRNIVEIFIENGQGVLTSLLFPKDLYGKAEWFGPSNGNTISGQVLQ